MAERELRRRGPVAEVAKGMGLKSGSTGSETEQGATGTLGTVTEVGVASPVGGRRARNDPV